ncbi:hypothetical protein [Kutzneria sp. 744]|uniref:hypothetical protein n=1 Tax=Kutzneria sp. (strain 744) TaxID=345341 RepID=UPI0012FB3CF6|nr:hypothetical protein [Kutzneria sp. 744]
MYAADHGFENLDTKMKELYGIDAKRRTDSGPPGHLKIPIGVLFDTDNPGALMPYGLRQPVGEETFRDIERTFFTSFTGRSATTQDYIDVANRVSGRDLTGYVRAWVYGDTTPPMPAARTGCRIRTESISSSRGDVTGSESCPFSLLARQPRIKVFLG